MITDALTSVFFCPPRLYLFSTFEPSGDSEFTDLFNMASLNKKPPVG
jgi:hypothetical protein